MPNFIPVEVGPSTRQDGFNPESAGATIPISSLTEEEAYAYGEEMKQAFVKHWRDKMGDKYKPLPSTINPQK